MLKKLLAFIYGLIFGIANIIPGVSGGTMMVVFGCYDIVCDAMALDFKSIKKNLPFLIPFAIGAAGGIVGFSFVATYMIDNFPVASYLFFIGLILGSIPTVYRTATKYEKLSGASIAPFILAFAAVIGLGILQNDSTSDYIIKQSPSAENAGITVVTLKNTSKQTVSEWVIEFDEGSVSAVGGASMFYNAGTFDKVLSIFTGEQNEKPNAFTAEDNGTENYKEIAPDQVITFTYKSSQGARLVLEPQLSYKVTGGLLLNILLGGFIAAVAMIIPGVSGSFVMVLFGIYATILSAIKNINILILLPAAIGILAGIILGAKLIKWLLSNHRMTVYSAILGLMIGSVFIIFPKNIVFGQELIIGIAVLVLGAAISLTVSMEKKSNEELKSTDKNL